MEEYIEELRKAIEGRKKQESTKEITDKGLKKEGT
jgi:hypothetical protein